VGGTAETTDLNPREQAQQTSGSAARFSVAPISRRPVAIARARTMDLGSSLRVPVAMAAPSAAPAAARVADNDTSDFQNRQNNRETRATTTAADADESRRQRRLARAAAAQHRPSEQDLPSYSEQAGRAQLYRAVSTADPWRVSTADPWRVATLVEEPTIEEDSLREDNLSHLVHEDRDGGAYGYDESDEELDATSFGREDYWPVAGENLAESGAFAAARSYAAGESYAEESYAGASYAEESYASADQLNQGTTAFHDWRPLNDAPVGVASEPLVVARALFAPATASSINVVAKQDDAIGAGSAPVPSAAELKRRQRRQRFQAASF